MLKKVIIGLMLFVAPALFAMSLSKLNSASKAELMEINGIGEAKATAIIKERKKGKFKSFDDFQRVDGIGEQTAANVKSGIKSGDKVKKVKKTTKTKPKTTKSKTTKKKSTTSKKSTKKETKPKAKSKSKKKKSKSTKDKKEKKTTTKKKK